MTTYDENGGYPHPDHIMTHKVSVAAFEAAGDPDRYPEAGEPWQPLKLYYNLTFHQAAGCVALHEAMLAAGPRVPVRGVAGGLGRTRTRGADRITTRVECAEYFPRPGRGADRARHPGRPDRPLVRLPMELQQQVWPTEDYQLARSLVDSRRCPRTTCSPASGRQSRA